MILISPVKILALVLVVQVLEISAATNFLTLDFTPSPDTAAEKAFLANPTVWLGKNAISSVAVFQFSLNKATRVDLKNGGIYSFRFLKLASNKYVYYAAAESAEGIKAYWLNTADKITVALNGPVEFIFTGELQGCSIHARTLSRVNFEVFHRNRQHLYQIYLDANKKPIDGNGVPIKELAGVTRFLDKNKKEIKAVANGKISLNHGILDKNGQSITTINGKEVEELMNDNLNRGTDEICQFLNYDLGHGKSISYEHYSANLPANYEAALAALAAERRQPMFTTPFLFRKSGKWFFVSQQIQYSGSGAGPAKGQIWDFRNTGQGYLDDLN